MFPIGSLDPPPFPPGERIAAGCEAGGSPGLVRDTQNRGHCCFCVYSGPRMDDVTPVAVESGSHESSTNRPSLRDNKSDVSIASFADLVQRRRLCLGCRNTGTGAGNIQTEGCASNYFLTSRRGKLRKKFGICRECSKATNSDHCKITAVTLCPARLANKT